MANTQLMAQNKVVISATIMKIGLLIITKILNKETQDIYIEYKAVSGKNI
jgi:hypothetical protein